MKKTLYIILALIIIAVAFLFLKRGDKEQEVQEQDGRIMSIENYAKNSTFTLEGEGVTLQNGVGGSVNYFGNEAKGDLNFDGKEDLAFLVTQNSGGSGTFFYVVAVLGGDNGYKSTNAFFIGDRIAPQTTEIQSQTGELRVNFADRKPGEPMTTQPSEGKVLLLKVNSEGVLEGLMR